MCSYEEMNKFIDEAAIKFYPNSLCFDDKSALSLYGTVNLNEFMQIAISVDACNQNTYKGKCESKEKIDQFMLDNEFFLTT